MKDKDAAFVEFVRAKHRHVRRTAFLLCGDWHLAEDLAQATLLKLYRSWSRAQRADSVDAYWRKVLVRTVIDHRRPMKRGEKPVAELPDLPDVEVEPGHGVDVQRALATLPPGQRAAVVLRYWEDQSVTQTAKLLKCSEGTVKSQCARGLAALRRELEGVPAKGGVA
ncbi:RNA polymerase subunit sigma-24 [Saccharothrix sp. ALI-22-I]|uniref:SigE family RNA polymerase sigma factor n=1 Tax=Saccharothrix sp. ALI-22-I TaxID=1933778 RepID=UPI00097BE564|nr:SigE family RNA polymerase sigma factor [Saccharothrix sp. ALI-22-I]ONI80202.1 RNA polymerase subunit sigma-24 [Saccharothrix sp. ALI-22-I]